MTVEALRRELGNAAFYALIRDWVAQRRYGTGTIPDFIALAEQHAGRDLDAFFDLWLFQRAKPTGPLAHAPTSPHPTSPPRRVALRPPLRMESSALRPGARFSARSQLGRSRLAAVVRSGTGRAGGIGSARVRSARASGAHAALAEGTRA